MNTMHRNHLILSLLGLLVVTHAAPDQRKKFVRVITEPKPGEEYVSIHTGNPLPGVERSLESDMDVNIQDEGQTGIKEVTGNIPKEEKMYAHKKLHPSIEEGLRKSKPEKKYTPIIDDESVTKPNKIKDKREGEIEPHNLPRAQEKFRENKEDDGLYDFVDSPYGSQIVGSASSQASRVNIKKAPNGQEYEYEYVYYYYDDDEEHAKPGSKGGLSTQNTTPTLQQTNSKLNKDIKENNKPKKPTMVQDENHFVQNTNKGRFSSVEHSVAKNEPEGHANFAVNDISERNKKTKESGRNLEEALSVPSSSLEVSEERLPHNPRFPVRSRGNSAKPQEFDTGILPATDTPITRIRTNNGVQQPGLDLVDSSAFRTHSNTGQHMATSLRHESNKDAVVQTTPADQVATINNAYNTQLTETVTSVTETVTETVSLDRNQDNTDVDTKGLSLTTTLTPDEVVTVTQRYTAGSTDKGAADLYAILQQARSEETANTISSRDHSTRFEDNETQFPTTLRLAPTTTTTTTTTTTPAPTTTTTTSTTAAPALTRPSPGSAGPVRSRYRGAVGSRNGLTSTTSTTTTTETPLSEEVTEKRKFKPSREKNTQGSVYSKRYQSSTAALDKESSTPESEVVSKAQKPSFGRQRTRVSKPISSTVPIDETIEVTSAAPKPNFAERSNLRRQNSRNKFTTLASTTTTTTTFAPQVAEEEEGNSAEHEVSEVTSTTAKAVGGRLRPNIRPLRPGLRLNFGGKGSSTTATPVPSTTQAPIVENSEEVEEKEVVQETSPTPTPDTLLRLKNRSRFRLPEKQSSLAPKQQTLAPPVNGQNRKHLLSNLLPKKKSIQTEEPPVVEEIKPVLENEQEIDQSAELQDEQDIDQQPPSSTTTSTTEAPTSSTNRLSSLLAKRRPLQRRPSDLSSKQSNQEE